jgi:hypothetical protein
VTGKPSVIGSLAASALLSVGTAGLCAAEADPLEDYRWEKRVLLIFADSDKEPEIRSLDESLEASACAIADRDLIIGRILASGDSSLEGASISREAGLMLMDRHQVTPGSFAVLLVGKDGGLKARYDTVPDLTRVFALIDGMPMRRMEMRTSGESCID